MDDGTGYELDDPKHPTFLDRYADAADLARKRAKEDAFMCSIDDIDESAGAKDEWRGVYPGYCINPETCRGYTHCPRNHSCIE